MINDKSDHNRCRHKTWASSEIIPSVYKRSRLKGSIKSDNQFSAVFCKYTWAMMLIWSAYCLNMMDHGFDWIFPVTTWIRLNWRKCILVHNFLLVWSSQSLLWKRLAWLPWTDSNGESWKSIIETYKWEVRGKASVTEWLTRIYAEHLAM